MDGMKLLLAAVAGVVSVGLYAYNRGWFTFEGLHRQASNFWGADGDINVDTTSIPEHIERPPTDKNCTVCLNPVLDRSIKKNYVVVMLRCRHWFHRNCLLRMETYNSSCPVCRRSIDFNSLHLEVVGEELVQPETGLITRLPPDTKPLNPPASQERSPTSPTEGQVNYIKPRSGSKDELDLD